MRGEGGGLLLGFMSPDYCFSCSRNLEGIEATQGRTASPCSGWTAEGSGHQQREHEAFEIIVLLYFPLHKIPGVGFCFISFRKINVFNCVHLSFVHALKDLTYAWNSSKKENLAD